jgi:hypothetical protein
VRLAFDHHVFSEEEIRESKLKLTIRNFLPGSIAGAVAVIITYPFELMRTRLAV